MTALAIDDFGGRIQALRPGAAQTVPIGVTSHASSTFGAATTVIRLVATSSCLIALGAAPTATADGHYLPAGAPEYFRVKPGEAVAVIRAATDGVLHLSEMT